MKKKAFLRGLLGFPLGVSVGYIITIVISLLFANGYYSPCVPQLADAVGSEINAVALQAILCGLLGAGCAAASVIWDVDRWGLVKQSGLYFLVLSLLMMPIAYAAYWMEHSVRGFLSYFGVFALIFALIWVIEWLVGRSNVKKLNARLNRNGKNKPDGANR